MLSKISTLSKQNRFIFDFSIIFLFSVLVVLPIILGGIPDLTDTQQHYQFAQTFYNSLLNGNYYPSWADQPNYGYGDVSIRFYPPLAYYLLSFFRIISGNWFDGSCLFFIFLYFLSGVGVYKWTREYFSENASLVSALAYLILPNHLIQVYLGAGLGEFTATAILPFCFLFIDRICRTGEMKNVFSLAFFLALLTLSHLPTIIIAAFTFSIYVLFSLKKTNLIQTFLKLSGAAILGASLSSFYWVRMITELSFVKHNSETFSSGTYLYTTQFLFSYLFPFSEISPTDPFGLVNSGSIICVCIFITYLILYLKDSSLNKPSSFRNVIIAAFFSLLMSSPLSLPIWKALPFLQKIQFPFRWLILFLPLCVFIVAAGFDSVIKSFKTPQRYLSLLALGVLLICLPFNYFRMMNSPITFPKEFFDRVIERNKTGFSYECWWAVWTPKSNSEIGLPRPELLPAKFVLHDRPFSIENWSATDRSLIVQPGSAGQAQFATMYYPHWQVTVNGQNVEVTPSEYGMISFPVPEQESQVRVYFQEPGIVLAAYYLSGFAFITFFILLSFCLLQNPLKKIRRRENVR